MSPARAVCAEVCDQIYVAWRAACRMPTVWKSSKHAKALDAQLDCATGYFGTSTSLDDMAYRWAHVQCAWGRLDAAGVDTRTDALELQPWVQYYRPSGAEESVSLCAHAGGARRNRVRGRLTKYSAEPLA